MIKTIYPILLASKSPRRQEILSQTGFSFELIEQRSSELVPNGIMIDEVPIYVSKSKLLSVSSKVNNNIVICADTIVVLSDGILTKPLNLNDSRRMLKLLSGASHRVITGVSIGTPNGEFHFSDTTLVTFKNLSDWETEYYINHHKPFDKAGSYGIQEFIGMIGVSRMEGSYFNVMGLPIHKVYDVLKHFIIK